MFIYKNKAKQTLTQVEKQPERKNMNNNYLYVSLSDATDKTLTLNLLGSKRVTLSGLLYK